MASWEGGGSSEARAGESSVVVEPQLLVWSKMDALAGRITKMQRAIAEEKQCCSCLEELLSQEVKNETELEDEVRRLQGSIQALSEKGPQHAVTENTLQSSLELVREQIGDEEQENLDLEDELQALSTRLKDVHQTHLAQLDDIKDRYGDRLVEGGDLEGEDELSSLHHQKTSLTAQITALKTAQRTQALEEWKAFKEVVVKMAEVQIDLRSQQGSIELLNTSLQKLKEDVRIREEASAGDTTEQERAGSSRGHQEQLVDKESVDSHLDLQHNFTEVRREIYSQEMRQFCAMFPSEGQRQDTQRYHAPVTTEGQRQDTQRYHAPVTTEGQRQDTQRYHAPVSTEGQRQDTQRYHAPVSTEGQRQDTQRYHAPVSTEGQRQDTQRYHAPVSTEGQRQDTQRYHAPVSTEGQRQDTQRYHAPVSTEGQRQDTQRYHAPVSTEGQRQDTQRYHAPVSTEGQRQDTQRYHAPVSTEGQRQDTQRYHAPVSTEGQRQDTQRYHAPVSTEGQRQDTQRYHAPVSTEGQRQDTQRYDASVRTEGQRQDTGQRLQACQQGQRKDTPRTKTVFSSKLSLIKLQVPKYEERKRRYRTSGEMEHTDGRGIQLTATVPVTGEGSDTEVKRPTSLPVSLPSYTVPSSVSFSSYTAPSSVSLPSYTVPSSVSISSYTVPSSVSISSYTVPSSVSLPSYTAPSSVSLPSYTAPSSVSLPSYTAPSSVSLPSYTVPSSVSLPSYTVPSSVSLPSYTVPSSVSISSYTVPSSVSLPSYTVPSSVSISSYTVPSSVSLPSYTVPSSVSISSYTVPSSVSLPSYTVPSSVSLPSNTAPSSASPCSLKSNSNHSLSATQALRGEPGSTSETRREDRRTASTTNQEQRTDTAWTVQSYARAGDSGNVATSAFEKGEASTEKVSTETVTLPDEAARRAYVATLAPSPEIQYHRQSPRTSMTYSIPVLESQKTSEQRGGDAEAACQDQTPGSARSGAAASVGGGAAAATAVVSGESEAPAGPGRTAAAAALSGSSSSSGSGGCVAAAGPGRTAAAAALTAGPGRTAAAAALSGSSSSSGSGGCVAETSSTVTSVSYHNNTALYPDDTMEDHLSSSQGFNLTEDSDMDTHIPSSSKMDTSPYHLSSSGLQTSSLVVEPPASRNVSAGSSPQSRSFPAGGSLYLSVTSSHTLPASAAEKSLSNVVSSPQSSLLPGKPLLFSSPHGSSDGTQRGTNSPATNLHTSPASDSLYTMSPILRPGASGGHTQDSSPSSCLSTASSYALMFGKDLEHEGRTPGAFSLFGSPATQTSAEVPQQEESNVNFSLFGDPSSPKRNEGFFNFNFGSDGESAQESSSSGFFSSLFGSPTAGTDSPRGGAGFKLF
nr:mucin-5AC-like [Procambarus clarkii]